MQRLFICLLCGLIFSTTVSAQNLNNTLRAKMSFPGQTLANIWGYKARDGKEYALLGGSKGMIIVDVSNPDMPQEIVQIPGPNNLWKEIKTYSHYAYVVSEGGQGIQVIDLAGLPSANLNYHYYKGNGAIANQLDKIHALHIDKNKGFLYAWGGGLFNGGAKIFNLKADPYNPVYVGKYDQLGYIHDGFVENDTMYSGHIYAGQFAIVNMANKNAPELLATQTTPNAFTHNTWPSDDHRTLFTTDERFGAFLASYDISDPTDIKLLDKIQSNPGSNSAVHNTYIYKNWAVTSWYTDGFTIVDVTRPDNMIQMGNYDTYAGSGGSFEGCWGVYPYLPSGNIIASIIKAQGTNTGELYIVTPDYRRACYLEGRVTNAVSGIPLNNALIEILGGPQSVSELSGSNGIFKTGQPDSGYFTVRVSTTGYQDYETLAYLSPGEVLEMNVALYPNDNLSVTGTILDQNIGLPIDGAKVSLIGQNYSNAVITDFEGAFAFSNVPPGTYQLMASAPNFGVKVLHGIVISEDQNFTLMLSQFSHWQGERPQLTDITPGQALLQVANPFHNATTVQYAAPANDCRLLVLNSAGQTLETIELAQNSGSIQIGNRLASGVYFLRLESAGKLVEQRKLIKN